MKKCAWNFRLTLAFELNYYFHYFYLKKMHSLAFVLPIKCYYFIRKESALYVLGFFIYVLNYTLYILLYKRAMRAECIVIGIM